jgi:Flp pilus assembly protein TadD
MNSAEFQHRAEQMETVLGYPHYATTYFRKAVALRIDFARAWEGLGEALENCGEGNQAIEIYRRILTLEPSSMEVKVRLATLLLNGATPCDRDKAQEAISLLQQASRAQPQDMFIHSRLFRAHISAGEITQCLRDFRNIVHIEPEWTQFHYEVIEDLMNKGRGTELRRAFERTTESEAQDFENWYGLGIICQCLHDQRAAISAYREAIRIAPSRAILYHNLGMAMLASGKPAEAMSLIEKAVSYSSTLAEPHFALAVNALNQGHREETAQHLRKFLQLGKPYLQGYLARAREMLGLITSEHTA